MSDFKKCRDGYEITDPELLRDIREGRVRFVGCSDGHEEEREQKRRECEEALAQPTGKYCEVHFTSRPVCPECEVERLKGELKDSQISFGLLQTAYDEKKKLLESCEEALQESYRKRDVAYNEGVEAGNDGEIPRLRVVSAEPTEAEARAACYAFLNDDKTVSEEEFNAHIWPKMRGATAPWFRVARAVKSAKEE